MQQKVLSFEGNVRSATPDSVEFLPLSNPRRPTELEQAYLDSFSILKYENRCSAFYGGPSAIAALNELTKQIRPKHLDRRIGIRMTVIGIRVTGNGVERVETTETVRCVVRLRGKHEGFYHEVGEDVK